jgi:L-serine dehydratase
MRAARQFAEGLAVERLLPQVTTLSIELFGSLGATGKGHGSDKAILLGLEGETPEDVDVDTIEQRLSSIRAEKRVRLLGSHPIVFDDAKQLVMHKRKVLKGGHVNAMRFSATDSGGNELLTRVYYSVGGGFVADKKSLSQSEGTGDSAEQPYPFSSASELLRHCHDSGLSISSLMLENEKVWRSEQQQRRQLLRIWQVMRDCVQRGCRTEGILPGGMKVKRRAAKMYRKLQSESPDGMAPLGTMDWVDMFALSVNEENAAGGRVVTAPTNGAAGIIPAVLHYYWKFCNGADDDGVVRFLLTAGAIGTLYKINASISGAEVGCQGEVGAACSMAAGGLTEVLGGTAEQVENAAEIAMEHNLGLTCDPIGGLVQVPCIERNAMAAIKAINASRLALRGDGRHYVSLDKVIKTMRETGIDMKTKYKETARGGLAVNVIEC